MKHSMAFMPLAVQIKYTISLKKNGNFFAIDHRKDLCCTLGGRSKLKRHNFNSFKVSE